MDDLEKRLRAAGSELASARSTEVVARDAAAALAVEADAAKMSQRRIAGLLGVDRMTVRKWVGKR